MVAATSVDEYSEVMLVSAAGIMTRTPVKEEDPRKGITTQGRATQGVKLMKLDEGDSLVGLTCIEEKDEEEILHRGDDRRGVNLKSEFEVIEGGA